MPGTRLLSFARLWFPPSTVSSVFEPLVADWQREWSDATPAQRQWVDVKGLAAFAVTLAMMTPRLILAPSSFSARPFVVAGGFWLLMSFVLLIPFLLQNGPLDLVWLVLPSCLTAMLPFAMLPAMDAIRREGDVSTPQERRAVIALAGLAVCGVVLGQWVTPVASQTFRNEAMSRMNGRPSVAWKGVRDRTTLDLIAGEGSTIPTPARTRELASRATLALLPAVLAWLRWRSLGRARNRSWPSLKSCLLAFAAYAAFFTLLPISIALERTLLAPGLGPLLALALFTVTTRTGIWLRQRAA
jgi:hypothetical protein